MDEHLAVNFFNIAQSLCRVETNPRKYFEQPGWRDRENSFSGYDMLFRIHERLKAIGCVVSARAAFDLAFDIGIIETPEELGIHFKLLKATITNEMESHLFLWMPPHRSEFYRKTAEDVLGQDGVNRFASVITEIEEAARCFALGRYTACAFHLNRMTEAGIKAFGKAIGFTPQNDNWGQVFNEFETQAKVPPKQRTGAWLTHAEFLQEVSGDLRAVKNAWRNEVMHLDAVYSEEQARHLIAVIPAFMKHIATKLDENGTLY